MSYLQVLDAYSDRYIPKYGVDKYKTVFEKVSKSKKIATLNGLSIQKRIAPTAHDFAAAVNEIAWFLFQSQETVALAALMAIGLWDQDVNRIYHFSTQFEVEQKAIAVLELLKVL